MIFIYHWCTSMPWHNRWITLIKDEYFCEWQIFSNLIKQINDETKFHEWHYNMTIKINICKANITFRTHCEALIQLFCETETRVSDSEIVAKSKLNLICKAYISSNVMNRDRWDKSRQIEDRWYTTNNKWQDDDEMIDNKTVKWQKR